MAKPKFDLVVVAVRYTPEGQVAYVRAYKRRGPTFSDRLKINRQSLVEELQNGQRVVVGKRVPQMAGTFEVADSLQLIRKNGDGILVSGTQNAQQDSLPGVPIF